MSLVILGVWRDLGVNLIADSLALWFGAVVVDAALEEDAKRRNAPLARAAYMAAFAIHRDLAYTFERIIERTVTLADRATIVRLTRGRDDEGLAELLGRLDFEERNTAWATLAGGGIRHETWRSAFPAQVEQWKRSISEALGRYGSALPPAAVGALQRIDSSAIFNLAQHLASPQFLPRLSGVVWHDLIDAVEELRSELSAMRVENALGEQPAPLERIRIVQVERLDKQELPVPAPSD